MRIACECVVVEVRYVADRVAEVCRVAGHPVKVRRLSVESLHLFSEVCRVAGHPVESRRLTAEVLRPVPPSVEVCRIANCDVPCLPLGVRVLRFRCGLLLGPC